MRHFNFLSAIQTFLCPWFLSLTIPLLIPGKVAKNRIANGTDVNPPHKYPWMVSIYFTGCYNTTGICISDHLCGGSVLDEYHILTAAHCCTPYPETGAISIDHLWVLTGLHGRNKLEPWSQNLSIADCKLHELYGPIEEDYHHDLAIIRVNGKIAFSDKVTPVNLPQTDFDVETDGEVMAILIGWGFLSLNDPPGIPKVLQELELPVVTTATCQLRMGDVSFYGENYSLALTDSMLCIGFRDGGNGACTQDSGGPLLLFNKESKTYTQIGILSWTIPPCGTTYTVSTRVSTYRSWIKHHISKCKARYRNNESH